MELNKEITLSSKNIATDRTINDAIKLTTDVLGSSKMVMYDLSNVDNQIDSSLVRTKKVSLYEEGKKVNVSSRTAESFNLKANKNYEIEVEYKVKNGTEETVFSSRYEIPNINSNLNLPLTGTVQNDEKEIYDIASSIKALDEQVKNLKENNQNLNMILDPISNKYVSLQSYITNIAIKLARLEEKIK